MSELKFGELIVHIESETIYCKDLKTQILADKSQFIIICPKCKKSTGLNLDFGGGIFSRKTYMKCSNCDNVHEWDG